MRLASGQDKGSGDDIFSAHGKASEGDSFTYMTRGQEIEGKQGENGDLTEQK